jgi:tetratricopeptide (TPR) repeat protein
VERAQEMIDLGMYDSASAMLDRYASFFKDEWEISFLYSRIFSEQNKSEEAIKHLHTALKMDPDNLDCILGLFYSYSQTGDVKKSLEHLEKAEKLSPRNEFVLNALIWYHTENCNFSKAIEYYEHSHTILARNPETLRNTGIAYERTGEIEKSRKCYIKVLEINPNFDDVRDMLADQYITAGKIDKSIELYEEYLKQSPDNVKALSRLVFCLSQNGQTADAESLSRRTISKYPNSPVGYVDLAYVFLNSDRHDEAIKSVDKAIDVSPLDSEALRVKAVILSEKNEDEAAENIFQKALAMDPENPEIARDYYQHLRVAGKTDKMLELVNRVIEQEKPYCVEDYWFLADYYRETGKNTRAFHYLRKAYQSMPGETGLIPPMVDILIDMGHLSMAIPLLSRYSKDMGWNEVMDEFSRRRILRKKPEQEGMRFLRFKSQNPRVFREYAFACYLKKILLYSFAVCAPFISGLSYLLFGYKGLIISTCSAAGILLVLKAVSYFSAANSGYGNLSSAAE